MHFQGLYAEIKHFPTLANIFKDFKHLHEPCREYVAIKNAPGF